MGPMVGQTIISIVIILPSFLPVCFRSAFTSRGSSGSTPIVITRILLTSSVSCVLQFSCLPVYPMIQLQWLLQGYDMSRLPGDSPAATILQSNAMR
jgi:hypothetical protein